MKKHRYVNFCAVLLFFGGLAWALKAAVILVAGNQPPLSFELGQILFPFGAIGLFLTLPRSAALAKVGAGLAGLALAGSSLALVYPLVPGADIPTAEEFAFPYSLFVLVGSIGGFVGLVLIAAAFFRDRPELGSRRVIPIIAALIPLPLFVTGFVHVELPILLVGIVWVVLASFILTLPVPYETT